MSEKASLHRGRGSEKHNMRDFDYENRAEHIDAKRTHLNSHQSFCKNGSELNFYEERYRETLDQQNDKHMEAKHYKRIKTMEEFMEANPPAETVLQYSKIGGVEIPPDVFKKVVDCYIEKVQAYCGKKGNDNLHILSVCVHADESTIHAHVRSIIDYKDEDGVVRIGQERGLAKMGFEAPFPDKLKRDLAKAEEIRTEAEQYVSEWQSISDKDGKYLYRKPVSYKDKETYQKTMKRYRAAKSAASLNNNRLITFTRFTREVWEDTLEEFGYACDRVRSPKAKHQTKEDFYKHMQIEEELVKREQKRYKELNDNQEEFISQRVQEAVAAIYDKTYKKALDDANNQIHIEVKKEMEEVVRQIAEARKELDEINLEKDIQLNSIAGNKDVIKMIENQDKIIAEQAEEIEKNKKKLAEQKLISESESTSFLLPAKYDSINKYLME